MPDRSNFRMLRRCLVVMSVTAGILAVPVAFGADNLPIEVGPADPIEVADRGQAMQLTDTLPPPPPTTAPRFPAVLRGDSLDLPAESGEGRRVVYSMGIQRVWLIEADGSLFTTYRVSGRLDAPRYGTFTVWSRSTVTCARKKPDTCMRFMVRFAYTTSGDNIGFHEIPQRNGVPLQTPEQLGAPLSGGCVRQQTADALVMWDWAQIGTKVVVVP